MLNGTEFFQERLHTYRGFIFLDEERKRCATAKNGEAGYISAQMAYGSRVKFRAEFLKGRILFQKSWGSSMDKRI